MPTRAHGNRVHWDVPGAQLCLIDHPAARCARHNCDTGHSTGRAMKSAVPAQGQAAGAPSAWSQPLQSPPERPRRWCDAGALGRQSVQAPRKAGDEGAIRGSGSDCGAGFQPASGRTSHSFNCSGRRIADPGSGHCGAGASPVYHGHHARSGIYQKTISIGLLRNSHVPPNGDGCARKRRHRTITQAYRSQVFHRDKSRENDVDIVEVLLLPRIPPVAIGIHPPLGQPLPRLVDGVIDHSWI